MNRSQSLRGTALRTKLTGGWGRVVGCTLKRKGELPLATNIPQLTDDQIIAKLMKPKTINDEVMFSIGADDDDVGYATTFRAFAYSARQGAWRFHVWRIGGTSYVDKIELTCLWEERAQVAELLVKAFRAAEQGEPLETPIPPPLGHTETAYRDATYQWTCAASKATD